MFNPINDSNLLATKPFKNLIRTETLHPFSDYPYSINSPPNFVSQIPLIVSSSSSMYQKCQYDYHWIEQSSYRCERFDNKIWKFWISLFGIFFKNISIILKMIFCKMAACHIVNQIVFLSRKFLMKEWLWCNIYISFLFIFHQFTSNLSLFPKIVKRSIERKAFSLTSF